MFFYFKRPFLCAYTCIYTFKPLCLLNIFNDYLISKSSCSEFSRYSNDFPANSAATKKCVCNLPLTTSSILEKVFLKKIRIKSLSLAK